MADLRLPRRPRGGDTDLELLYLRRLGWGLAETLSLLPFRVGDGERDKLGDCLRRGAAEIEEVFRRRACFSRAGDLDLDIDRLEGRPRLDRGLCEKLPWRVLRRGGEREMLSDASRPLLEGVMDRDTGRPFRLGGVIDLDRDLDTDRETGLPLAIALPLPLRGGVLEMDRLRPAARLLEYDLDRDLDRDEPV